MSTKLIKRYSNRKLYDTQRSCYVTLEEVSGMVRGGLDIRIVDNKTGEDITAVTLAQIVFEQEKRDQRTVPLQTLRTMIQSPTELIQRLSKPVADLREDAQRQVERLRKLAEAPQDEIVVPFREFIESIPRALDEMQARIDERIRDGFDNLTHVPRVSEDVARLKAELARLERRVVELERRERRHHEETSSRVKLLDQRERRNHTDMTGRVRRVEATRTPDRAN
jgi:polyhydroxyalkanoate synthesis repressor PhaR